MMFVAKLTKEQVERREYERYNPNTHDFRWSDDRTEVTVIGLDWHDENSYRQFQGRE